MRSPEDIDRRLALEFGRRALPSFQVHAKVFPSYRFVDLFKAANEYFAGRHGVVTIESQHDEDLNSLLHVKRPRWAVRRIKGAPSVAWPVGPGEEIYLPVDGFWLCATRSAEGRDQVVVRLRYEQNQDIAVLEVAAEDGAAGEAILRRAIFALARLLQPSLVIFEDVDLVFTSREMNLYSSVLGDLLDQMDGLRPYEDIGFILTTNAIDRMEAAIKDRPGRISQCLYFGVPKPGLRKRYLQHYLRHYETIGLDMDKLVVESDGSTPAFLKEWVHRSVQIALEREDDAVDGVRLSNEDFKKAMSEMRKFSEGSTGRIIGFQVR